MWGDFSLNVDLCLPSSGVTAIFGPSGCGKTTLLRAIAGLERYDGSHLSISDEVWQSNEIFVPPHKRNLGYVFQEASLFEHLSVRGNLEYGVKRASQAGHRIALDKAIDLLGISSLLQRSPATLSGGERQRVAIARALAISPNLLLMDEPLAALDASRKQEILPYIESLHHELDIPILYVSHAHEEIARLADELVLMETGRIISQGGVHEMFTRLDLALAHESDASAIVEARVVGHDENYHLSQLNFAGGSISVARSELEIGDSVRLRLAARDISLTLEHPSATSILNIIPVSIDALAEEGGTQMTVRLLAGGVPILSRITRKSAVNLGLEPGMQVYAQIKSVALLS